MKGRKTTVRVGRATQKPQRILADDAYWNVPFLERYLNRCNEIAIHEPLKGYEMAGPVVALADTRITIRERPGAYKSAVERRSYRVRARSVLASCARRIGGLGEAEELYAAAFDLAEKRIHPAIKADLHTRYGWLLVAQGDAAAVEQAETAVTLAPDKVTLAEALVLRGVVAFKFEEKRTGLEYMARAVASSKARRTTRRGQHVFAAALHGLVKILSECHPLPDTQRKAYVLLEEVKSYLAGRPKSVAKMQVYWQMGRIAFNLGYDRHGPRLLKRARKGLLPLGELLEYALISLDLAGFYLQSGELAEYDALVAETYAVLDGCDNPELLQALASWSRDVRASASELSTARLAIEELKNGGSAPA